MTELLFLSLSVEKLVSLNLENFIGRMRSLRGHHVWSDHDETINLNKIYFSPRAVKYPEDAE